MKSLSTILRDELAAFEKEISKNTHGFITEVPPLKKWLTTHDSKIISTIYKDFQPFLAKYSLDRPIPPAELRLFLDSLLHNSNI